MDSQEKGSLILLSSIDSSKEGCLSVDNANCPTIVKLAGLALDFMYLL